MKLKPKKLPTLLLVTRSPIVRTFFETVKTKLEDYALICADSDREALHYIETTFISFVIIDDKTPEIELIPLCKKIRATQDHEHTPILIITGHLKKTFTRNLLKAGATDFLREPLDEDEFLHRMEMASDIMETQQKITALSTRFTLPSHSGTSLKNRTIMDDRAIKVIEEALTKKTSLALLIMEIDQYQKFQKSRGENGAHALLVNFEDQIQKLLRYQDLIFNQKEGKFAIFLPEIPEKEIHSIAQNIQKSLERESLSSGIIRFDLTLSIGIVMLEKAGDISKSPAVNLQRLMSSAEDCLNQAKKTGNTIISQP